LERQIETSSVTLESAERRLRRLAADYLRTELEADGLDQALREQRAAVSRKQQRLEALLTEIVQLSRRESGDPRRLAQLRAVAGSLAGPFAAARAALDDSLAARAVLDERRAEIEWASIEVRQTMLDAEARAEQLADAVDANRRAATEATRRLESATAVVKTASLRLERVVAGRALATAEMPSASVAATSVGRSTRILSAPRALTAQARLVEPPTRPVAHYDLPKTAIPGIALGGSGRELGGGHVVPVAGAVVSRFGEGQKPPFDQGLTIEVEDRRLVRAPRDGRIVFADSYEGFGRLLIIDHGNEYHSLLSGLSRFVVHEGWRVRAGQMIGTLEPGEQTAGRLYIELRRRGIPVDPLTWFAAGQDKVRS
jgi:septal ring factor EnvC (AmiA/AmiB activator)